MRPFDQAPIVLADRCIAGVQANVQRCEEPVEQSVLMCTSLAPLIGYDTGAAIAKEAFAQGKTVRQVAIEKHALGESELNKALDPRQMTERHGRRTRPVRYLPEKRTAIRAIVGAARRRQHRRC